MNFFFMLQSTPLASVSLQNLKGQRMSSQKIYQSDGFKVQHMYWSLIKLNEIKTSGNWKRLSESQHELRLSCLLIYSIYTLTSSLRFPFKFDVANKTLSTSLPLFRASNSFHESCGCSFFSFIDGHHLKILD